jgi:hypothetical protein
MLATELPGRRDQALCSLAAFLEVRWSAGARLTVMRRDGSASPDEVSAARTRSRASDTALSPRPTTLNAGRPDATCTCTVTLRASIPSNATVETRWTMPIPLQAVDETNPIHGARTRTFAEQTNRRTLRTVTICLQGASNG